MFLFGYCSVTDSLADSLADSLIIRHKDVSNLIKSIFSVVVKPVCIGLMSMLISMPLSANVQQVLTATLEQRFDPTKQILSRTRVLVNDNGLRLESLPLDIGQLVISDYAMGKIWFVDKQRSFVHEVPYTIVEDAPRLTEAFISLPGSLDSIPCSGQDKSMTGHVEYKGASVQRWQCTFNGSDGQYVLTEESDVNDLPEEQYFSEQYNLVVYSKSRNGIVSELVNISFANVDGLLFSPPADFKRVSIEQFLGQYQALGKYEAYTE